MLVEFKVGNFLSFKDIQVLRMRRGKSDNETGSDFAFIYGANSSGKSNLIKAMDFARKLVLGKKTPNYRQHVNLENEPTENSPSYFEFVIEIDGVRYSYGFEIDLDVYNKEIDAYEKKDLKNCIKSEWLIIISPKEETVFEYECNKNKCSVFRSNKYGLALSKDDKEESKDISKIITQWFRDKLIVRLSESEIDYIPVQKNFIQYLTDNLKKFDTGISEVVSIPFNKRPEIPYNLVKKIEEDFTEDDQLIYIKGNARKRYWLIYLQNDRFRHKSFSEIRFKHNSKYKARIDEESTGTVKIIQLLSLLSSQETMDHKGTIAVDEIECSIHALAIGEIVKMFKSKTMEGTQLIFTTHQHTILEKISEAKDIWFVNAPTVENNKMSELYSLESFKGEIKRYGEMYLDGRFSAVPIITDYYLEDSE